MRNPVAIQKQDIAVSKAGKSLYTSPNGEVGESSKANIDEQGNGKAATSTGSEPSTPTKQFWETKSSKFDSKKKQKKRKGRQDYRQPTIEDTVNKGEY